MSIKNILVGLAPRTGADPGEAFAISMAKALKADVTGRLYTLEPDMSVDLFDGLPVELLQTYRASLKKDAEAAAKRFEVAAAKAKVHATRRIDRATLAMASTTFAHVARTYDVSVLTQSDPSFFHVGDVFIEAALFHSGRPAIIVPRKTRSNFSLDRVLIAWDGSLHSARAVAASMPILALAKKIEVLTVGEKSKGPETHVADLVQHLKRHGFDVKHKHRNGNDVPKTILKEARAASASLLVMGAYGHTRLREFVFGGVTRVMLTQATLPVMMTH